MNKMAPPLIPIAGAGALGTAGGMFLGSDEDEQRREDEIISKKDVNVDARQQTFSPQMSRAVQFQPQVQIDSPEASQSARQRQRQTPRQEIVPKQKVPVSAPTSQETGGQDQSGLNLEKLGLTALAVGGGAYVLGEVL